MCVAENLRGPLTVYRIYTMPKDKTTFARVGKYTCKRLMVSCWDSLG